MSTLLRKVPNLNYKLKPFLKMVSKSEEIFKKVLFTIDVGICKDIFRNFVVPIQKSTEKEIFQRRKQS